MGMISWPEARRAETQVCRARAQAGDGSTTLSVRRTPMRKGFFSVAYCL